MRRKRKKSEDSERIVRNRPVKNHIEFASVLFVSPYSIWCMWKHKEELYIRESVLWLWTFVGSEAMVRHVIYIV